MLSCSSRCLSSWPTSAAERRANLKSFAQRCILPTTAKANANHPQTVCGRVSTVQFSMHDSVFLQLLEQARNHPDLDILQAVFHGYHQGPTVLKGYDAMGHLPNNCSHACSQSNNVSVFTVNSHKRHIGETMVGPISLKGCDCPYSPSSFFAQHFCPQPTSLVFFYHPWMSVCSSDSRLCVMSQNSQTTKPEVSQSSQGLSWCRSAWGTTWDVAKGEHRKFSTGKYHISG
ncbi:hypothetical protein V8C42DRAFT_267745 [Trichoderma barbatum]